MGPDDDNTSTESVVVLPFQKRKGLTWTDALYHVRDLVRISAGFLTEFHPRYTNE